MSPDERQMISGLFDRLRGFGPPQKDRDAETLINQSLRTNADAGYMLVQSVLVQENVIESQGARVAELEARVRDLEDQMARSAPAQASSGGFLGGLFGGGAKPASVPTAGRAQPNFMPGASAQPPGRSPWGNQGAQPGPGYAPQGGYQQPMQQGAPMMAPQAAPAGGGFMRTAMATAAGVAGGMLVANSISSMMSGGHGHGSAQAAGAGAGSIGHDPAAPQSAGYDANDPAYGQTAAADANDPAYDPQPAAYEDNDPAVDSGGGWGGEDV
jgi:uncharacterized protein